MSSELRSVSLRDAYGTPAVAPSVHGLSHGPLRCPKVGKVFFEVQFKTPACSSKPLSSINFYKP